jgi:general secretion pathway protein N
MSRRLAPAQRTAPWPWTVLGASSGLVLAVVLGAPARWLASGLESATQGHVRLQAASGTVWHGQAHLTLAANAGGLDARSLPGRLDWRWGWDRRGLTLALSHDCCTRAPLQLHLGWDSSGWRVALDDAPPSQWPMAVLEGLGAPWNTLQAEGQLQLQTQGLVLHWAQGRMVWHGHAELQAKDIASRLSTLRPMGSYRITLQGQDEGTATPDLKLETVQGPLQLSGSGQWVGHRLRFTGEARADESAQAALNNLLNIIGRRDGTRSRLSLG